MTTIEQGSGGEAAQGFTSSDDEQEILALVERVNASAKEANDALDDALSFIAESKAH